MSNDDLFPIHVVAGRGLIYDLEILKLLREKYHVCGTLTGILPDFPQQNVFQGLPLQLMPEDIELLVYDLEVAYLVNDHQAHQSALLSLTCDDLLQIEQDQDKVRYATALAEQQELWIQKKKILEKHGQPVDEAAKLKYLTGLKSPTANITHEIATATGNIPAYDMFAKRSTTVDIQRPDRAAYSIFKHLQILDFYLSPGLRFGGQFLAYPGDPLRFHSHYIVIGLDWDQEFPVMDIVGGGRLATNVKKCWVIGAKDEKEGSEDVMRLFSIEWARFG